MNLYYYENHKWVQECVGDGGRGRRAGATRAVAARKADLNWKL